MFKEMAGGFKMFVEITSKWHKVVNYIIRHPSHPIHLLGHILFIVSFFNDFIAKHFYLIIICFILALLIDKKYKNIGIMIAIYVVFWGSRVLIGGFLTTLLSLGLFGWLFYSIGSNFKTVMKDAERDKDEFVLKVLEKMQVKDTPYMIYLRDKIGKGKN
jgi:hypothetical protein